MTKLLTLTQLDHFHQHGYVAPIRVMSELQAAALRERLEEHERANGGPLKGAYGTRRICFSPA